MAIDSKFKPKTPKSRVSLIKQGFIPIAKIFKKPQNQWICLARQTLPPFAILHCEH
ncbi:hypothetical protein HMPREF0204_13721 [Chryseobacterium gleum ATCC 35910]|uniref:Uncharacterized protein n=1 Tax=Chryseobacterium gleum ATCC 35910 TaxID=525257 RepID=A0ABN0ANM8_CHRGE|nr:hypothetical protein HMPREF0204_13721 [Chryseobacterium gleum ATCC 35910]